MAVIPACREKPDIKRTQPTHHILVQYLICHAGLRSAGYLSSCGNTEFCILESQLGRMTCRGTGICNGCLHILLQVSCCPSRCQALRAQGLGQSEPDAIMAVCVGTEVLH